MSIILIDTEYHMAYGEYRGRSIGRLLRFLYEYSHLADGWVFGNNNNILSHNGPNPEVVATYEWDGDSDTPTFKFTQEYEYLNSQQNNYKSIILDRERSVGRDPHVIWDIASLDRIIYARTEVREPKIGMEIMVNDQIGPERRKIVSIEDGVLYTAPYCLREKWKVSYIKDQNNETF